MTENKSLDLASLNTTQKASEGIEVELLHPTTLEPIGGFITVVGSDSNQYSEAQDRAGAYQAKRAKEDGKELKVYSRNAEFKRRIVQDCIVGWRDITVDGKDFKFSGAAKGQLLRDYPWIVVQLWSHIHDRSLFFRGGNG